MQLRITLQHFTRLSIITGDYTASRPCNNSTLNMLALAACTTAARPCVTNPLTHTQPLLQCRQPHICIIILEQLMQDGHQAACQCVYVQASNRDGDAL